MRDWLIKSRDNYKEYRNSRCKKQPLGQRESVQGRVPRPPRADTQTFFGEGVTMAHRTVEGSLLGGTCWKPTLWDAGKIRSLGGVLPEALHGKTTPGECRGKLWASLCC